MNFYISDLHFGHKNVIKFDNRPFSSVEEMDAKLIELWNRRVQSNDEVFILGDFAFCNELKPSEYLKQLKGKKHLIIGNHDTKLIKDEESMSYFEDSALMKHVTDEGKQICLCHYPLAEWYGMYKGSWHIYGHIHNSKNEAFEFMKTKDHALNAGCMINNYAPVSFNELVRNNERYKAE
jgi:calcineurin-like phosphoesterase family protein